jgi:glycosyltransferase involved in cell wall biosynthesis
LTDRHPGGATPSLRILLLAPQPFFEVRGTPLAVLAMVRALTAAGHRVELLTYPQGQAVEVPGLVHRRSLRLPVGKVRAGPSMAKLALDVPFVAEAALLLVTRRFDVVHAVEEAAHLIAPVALLLRVPLVMDVDSSIPDQLRYSGFASRGPLLWAAEALERYALRRAAAVVTVCASLTAGVRRRAPGARVFQIEDPPLVDGSVATDAADVARLRAALGLSPGPVALYSGNFEAYQGVEMLVEASGLVPNVQIVLMGGEPREIEALVARGARVRGRCCFAGKRPPAELPAFLALADVLVSPRIRGENTPFKVYTYLASGKPLVATRIPSHTQLLDESTSFVVDATAEGLARGIESALADPTAAASRGRRGREMVEERFSAARYIEKVRAAYAVVAATGLS